MTDVGQHAAAQGRSVQGRSLGGQPRRGARLVIARDGAWFRLGERTRWWASAWPDERIGRDSARNRLYVAINALRELGLRTALVRRADGYLIPPRIVLELK